MDVHPPKNGINRYWSIPIWKNIRKYGKNHENNRKIIDFLGKSQENMRTNMQNRCNWRCAGKIMELRSGDFPASHGPSPCLIPTSQSSLEAWSAGQALILQDTCPFIRYSFRPISAYIPMILVFNCKKKESVVLQESQRRQAVPGLLSSCWSLLFCVQLHPNLSLISDFTTRFPVKDLYGFTSYLKTRDQQNSNVKFFWLNPHEYFLDSSKFWKSPCLVVQAPNSIYCRSLTFPKSCQNEIPKHTPTKRRRAFAVNGGPQRHDHCLRKKIHFGVHQDIRLSNLDMSYSY